MTDILKNTEQNVTVTQKDKFIFWLVSVLFFMSITVYRPYLANYMTELGSSSLMIGFTLGVPGLMSIFLRLPLGIYSSHTGKRKSILQLGIILIITGWTIAYLYPSPTTIFIGKILSGFTTVTWVLYNVIFISMFKKDEVVKAVSIIGLCSPMGSFVGNIIGGFLSQNIGYKYTFLGSIVISTIALILSPMIKEIPVRKIHNLKELINFELTDTKLWLLSVMAISALLVPYATRDAFLPILAKSFGATAMQVSLMSNINLFCHISATYMAGSVMMKFMTKYNIATLGALILGIGTISIITASDVHTLYIMQGFNGFGFGLFFTAIWAASMDHIPSERHAVRMGAFQAIYSLGMFLGPFLLGAIKQYFGLNIGLIFIGGQALFASIIIYIYLQRRSPERYIKH